MSIEAHIPTISGEIAVGVINRYLTVPKSAVRETTQKMDEENPQLLGHSIIGAFTTMQSIDERVALLKLRGSLYYYQCYSDETQKSGIPLIWVSRDTVQRIFAEDLAKYQSLEQVRDERERQRLTMQLAVQAETFTESLKNNNRYLFSCMRGFEEEEKGKKSTLAIPVSHVVQGGVFIVHHALSRQLNIANEDALIPEEDPDQGMGLPFLPPVSGSSARKSLVEIILDRKEFTKNSLEYLMQYSPDWATALVNVEHETEATKTEYEFFTSMVVGIYAREFQIRGIQFPNISLDIINDSLGIEIANGRMVDFPDPKLRIEKANQTLKELEEENLPLYRAYSIVASGRRLNDLSNPLAAAAFFATTDAYALIRAQGEAEYWENLSR